MTKPRILVTGGGGLLGRTLGKLSGDAFDIVALGRADLDIADPASIARALDAHAPSVLINPAAMTDVDGCERDATAAGRANVDGPRALARACRGAGVRFVHVSTDFVFDGTKREPYTTDDEPRPLSVYGRTKRDGELAALDADPSATVVRVSWLFGPGGRNFLSKIYDYAAASPRLKGITDMRSIPTYAPDGARRILDIVAGGVTGTYHVTNSGEATWFEVARAALDAGGRSDVALDPVTVADLGLPAPRPAYSAMQCLLSSKLGLAPLRDWREALPEFARDAGAGSRGAA